MKKRLNGQLMLLSLLGIGCTLVILCAVFFRIYNEQVLYDLKANAHIMKYAWNAGDEESEAALMTDEDLADYRITVIGEEGQVLLDSDTDADDMENHLDRPEVEEAFENGWGSSVRESATMGKSTYYYALLLDDGCVLRVSTEARDVWTVLLHAVPLLLVLLCLILVLCLITSHFMARSFLAPIESLARQVDNKDEIPVYPEMEPFVTTIRKQHEELQRASDMRQEFTANVSHELKTPLTAISGYAELIENGLVPEEKVAGFAGEIRKNCRRLLDLIDDVIRLSQLDAPTEDIRFESVSLYQVTREVVEAQQITADQAQVQMTISAAVESEICANRDMIEELVSNLVSNAIRYNYRGGAVHVSVISSKESVTLSVQDTGIGISPEQQARIFERFYRVDKSRSRSAGGTGLGLAIVKHIAVRHDAQIHIVSEVGKGSEFQVVFPRQMSKKQGESAG